MIVKIIRHKQNSLDQEDKEDERIEYIEAVSVEYHNEENSEKDKPYFGDSMVVICFDAHTEKMHFRRVRTKGNPSPSIYLLNDKGQTINRIQ